MLFACDTVFVVLDGTILPVALLQIGHALPPEPVALGWAVVLGTSSSTACSALLCRFADLYGLRRAYSVEVVVFFLGSVACALAPTYAVLIAGRLVRVGAR